MGKVDNITHEYIQQPDRFADLFNYHVFHGKRVIDKNNLKDINTVSFLNFILSQPENPWSLDRGMNGVRLKTTIFY